MIPGSAYKLGRIVDPVEPRFGKTRIGFIDEFVVESERAVDVVPRTELLIHAHEEVFKRLLIQA